MFLLSDENGNAVAVEFTEENTVYWLEILTDVMDLNAVKITNDLIADDTISLTKLKSSDDGNEILVTDPDGTAGYVDVPQGTIVARDVNGEYRSPKA